MKLYLIRHGQSEANFHKIHAGWGAYPLTEKGREDAIRAGRMLKDLTFDKVYSSDLVRAIETQRIALPNAEAEQSPLIREVNVGNLIGRSFAECLEEMGQPYADSRRLFEFEAYGGESYDSFCRRIREFLHILENAPYERVVAFCHGGLINTMLDVITGERLLRSHFACENCSLSIFEYKNETWKLRLWNYTGDIN